MRPIELVWRSAIVFSLLLLTPVTFSGNGGFEDNLACSSEKKANCYREIDSVCTAGSAPAWNYYNKEEL